MTTQDRHAGELRAVIADDGRRMAPLGHVEAAIIRLPLVKGRPADPVLAANIRRPGSRLLLPQDRNDLLFREPRSRHRPSASVDGLYSNLEELQGIRSSTSDLKIRSKSTAFFYAAYSSLVLSASIKSQFILSDEGCLR